MKKAVVLVVYSCKFTNKEKRLGFEKEIRDGILVQNKEGICVEFYNEKDFDLLDLKFNRKIKRRNPDSAVFLECKEEMMYRVIRTIEERVSQEVSFFFRNIHLDQSLKATKILSVKQIPLFLTAVKK